MGIYRDIIIEDENIYKDFLTLIEKIPKLTLIEAEGYCTRSYSDPAFYSVCVYFDGNDYYEKKTMKAIGVKLPYKGTCSGTSLIKGEYIRCRCGWLKKINKSFMEDLKK